MDFERMTLIFHEVADAHEVKSEPGYWEFSFHGIPIVCISDAAHDRMRLVSPILKEQDLTEEHRTAILRANFHTALDARYAAGNGVLFSTFIHPLSSLTERDLRSAIRQVATLVATFGSSYSSGELVFPGGAAEPESSPRNGANGANGANGTKKTKI